MPTVPRVSGPEVAPQAPPNAMFSTAGGDAAAFGGIQARQVGEAAVIAQRVKERADVDAVFRAETALKTDYLEFERGELGKLGANADGVAKRTREWWDKALGTYGANLNGEARRAFDARAGAVRLAGTETLMRHEQAQKNRSVVESANASAQTSANLAVSNPTSEAIANAQRTIETSTRAVASLLGQTEEQRQQSALALTSQMHKGIIERLAAADTDAAKAHYYANKKQIVGADYAAIEKHLDTAGQAEKAQKEGVRIAAKYGPDQTAQAQDEIDALDVPAAQKKAIRDEVEHRHMVRLQDQNTLHANATGRVMAAYSQGATLAQLQKLPEWTHLKDGGAAIKEHVTDRQHALAVRGEEDRARALRQLGLKNFAAYGQYSDPRAIDAMSREEISALLPVIGPDLTMDLLRKKDGFVKSEEKLRAATMDANDFNDVADKMGLKPFDRSKSADEQGRLNELHVRVEGLIDQWQRDNKREMPREDKRRMMTQELSRMVALPGALWGTNTKPAILLKPDEVSRIVRIDMTQQDKDEFLARMETLYARTNDPKYKPTDANLAAYWLSLKRPDWVR